jgi:hypothetical protein
MPQDLSKDRIKPSFAHCDHETVSKKKRHGAAAFARILQDMQTTHREPPSASHMLWDLEPAKAPYE